MDTRDRTIIRNGVRKLLDRRAAARDAFATTLANLGAGDKASAVADYYIAQKIARYDGHRFTVTHGAFLDAPVIARAVALVPSC